MYHLELLLKKENISDNAFKKKVIQKCQEVLNVGKSFPSSFKYHLLKCHLMLVLHLAEFPLF